MRRDVLALGALTIFAAILRLLPALEAGRLTYDGYFTLAQVNSILSTGLLSYDVGAAYVVVLPFFYYVLAVFAALLSPVFVLLVLPNLLGALIVPVVFLLSAHLTRRSDAALVGALCSAIIPVFVGKTFGSASPYALAVPMLFFSLYLFLRLPNRFAIRMFLALGALLAFTHPLIIILLGGLWLYLVLLKVENMQLRRAETEAAFFITLFSLWVLFIFFKPMIAQGLGPLSRYVTEELFARIALTPASAIALAGFVPATLGAVALYSGIRARNKAVFLLGSVAFVALVLMSIGLFDPVGSLAVLGVVASVLLAQFYANFQAYFSRTRVSWLARPAALLLIVLLIISSLAPLLTLTRSETQAMPPHSVLAAFDWAKENIEHASVLALPKWGFALWAVSSHSPVTTSFDYFAPDAQQRQADVRLVYSGISETESIRVMSTYGASYIFSSVPRRAVTSPAFLEADKACFRQVYWHPPYLYNVVCELS